MTMYVLALVPTKAEYPDNCLGCALNPPNPWDSSGCKFRELCGEGILKAKYMPVDSTQLLDELPTSELSE